MAEENLAGMKIAILVAQNFEQSELVEPNKALKRRGDHARAALAPSTAS